ncbi:hypothetical protein DPX39_030005000 [Trypanosoma brucei equiperdum]|uniref:Trypanosomal VSG domain containing protein n=1 Tax=Trypanosoma brucei equiperdum TaxID=630700 RepID=A0A3L6LBR9_9TRYP|nr:hypothetical protein DPX39_030005000 [Trypanosoma brucei equiperdum]
MSTNVVAILAIAVLQAIPAAVKSQKAQLTDVERMRRRNIPNGARHRAGGQEALNSGTNPLSKQRQTYAIAAAAEQDQENACLLAAIAAAAAAAAKAIKQSSDRRCGPTRVDRRSHGT